MIEQATVRRGGVDGGSLVRDDGTSLEFEASAVDAAVRLLRVGQRVTVDCVDGRVVSLTVCGLPFT